MAEDPQNFAVTAFDGGNVVGDLGVQRRRWPILRTRRSSPVRSCPSTAASSSPERGCHAKHDWGEKSPPQRLGSPSGGAGAQRLRGACRGRCSRWPAPIDFSPHQNRHRRGDHWSPAFSEPPFFSFSSLRKKRTAAASEEASCIALPPGRRKLHIRWLLLPFQTVTAALGHSLGRADRVVRPYKTYPQDVACPPSSR